MTKTIWAVVGVSVAATVAMAVALVIVLAGGDDDPASERPEAPLVGTGAAPFGEMPEELDEFRACLEDQGVELPGPGEQPSGGSADELQKAFESCQDLLPEGGQFRFGPSDAPVPQN